MSFLLVQKFKFKISLKDKKLLFLIFINLVPIGLMFLTSILTGSKIRTMWMTPFYLFFGVLIVYIFQAQIHLKKLNGFISAFLILFVFSPFAYAYISISETDKRTDYQGKAIAIKVQYVWNQSYKEHINVVLGDEWQAGNLSYHLKSRPVWEGFITKDKLNSLTKFTCIDNICIGNR
jgi:4-amino-4-deoxy-L-arabinose transferase-like glycosyltransferase